MRMRIPALISRMSSERLQRKVAMKRMLLLIQAPLAVMVAYLDILSIASLLWRRSPTPVSPRFRFAMLIPAHDEELLLPRLLRSIAEMQYPPTLYDVHVVADNCSDRTAAVAAGAGATVHERSSDQTARGKGFALRWLLERLRGHTPGYDAYVILDADSVVSQNFLLVMNAHLARGDTVIQSYYGVLNHEESWASALRYAALALYNGLRPRGRDALGLSAGLRGNGMCFTAAVIDRFGWDAFTLAEDAEFHLRLVESGIKVAYAGQATVLAEMPVTLEQSRSQNMRWERGRLQMLRAFVPRLLAQGLRRRDPVRLDAIAEQLVPPLSVLTGASLLAVVVTGLLRARSAWRLALAVALGQTAYVVTGLVLVRASPRSYLTLLTAPLYIAWKVWLYALAALGRHDTQWIRTRRHG